VVAAVKPVLLCEAIHMGQVVIEVSGYNDFRVEVVVLYGLHLSFERLPLLLAALV